MHEEAFKEKELSTCEKLQRNLYVSTHSNPIRNALALSYVFVLALVLGSIFEMGAAMFAMLIYSLAR